MALDLTPRVQTKRYVLSKFPIRKIKGDPIVFMIARRGSGMSTGIRDISLQRDVRSTPLISTRNENVAV